MCYCLLRQIISYLTNIDSNCIGHKNPNSKEDRFNRGIAIDSLLDGDKSSGGGGR